MDASSLNESLENSENVVNIKIQGSESNSVKHFKVLKVGQPYAYLYAIPILLQWSNVSCEFIGLLQVFHRVALSLLVLASSCCIKSVSVSLILLH